MKSPFNTQQQEYFKSLLEQRRAKIQRDYIKYSNVAQLRDKNLLKLKEIQQESNMILEIKKVLK